MTIRSFPQLKRLLGDGVMRRLYLREMGRMVLAYYILFIPEHNRYNVFHCASGIEYRIDEMEFFQLDPLCWAKWLRNGDLLIELE